LKDGHLAWLSCYSAQTLIFKMESKDAFRIRKPVKLDSFKTIKNKLLVSSRKKEAIFIAVRRSLTMRVSRRQKEKKKFLRSKCK
jgi:hypothetical protein